MSEVNWFEALQAYALTNPADEVLEKVADTEILPVEYEGVKVHLRNNRFLAIDFWILQEVKREYFWDRLSHVQTAVDVGAHIGFWSLFLKQRFPDAAVAAIEVDPYNFQFLQHNLQGQSGVSLFNARCGYLEGDYVIARHLFNSGGHVVVPRSEFEQHLTAPEALRELIEVEETVSLEQIMTRSGMDAIDVLKLDTEGHEPQILAGCTDETMDSIGIILGETHVEPEVFENLSNQRLKRHGFKVEYLRCVPEAPRHIFFAQR